MQAEDFRPIKKQRSKPTGQHWSPQGLSKRAQAQGVPEAPEKNEQEQAHSNQAPQHQLRQVGAMRMMNQPAQFLLRYFAERPKSPAC